MNRAVAAGVCALLALLVAALVAWSVWTSVDQDSGGRGSGADGPSASADERAASSAVELAGGADANARRAEPTAPERVDVADARARRVGARGRVLDIEGEPVADVAIARMTGGEAPFATSADDGSFALPADDAELVVVDERWFTLRDTEPLSRGHDAREVLLVVAPALRVGGRVVDPASDPIEGATVRLDVPWSSYAGFPIPLDRGRPTRSARATSDARGAFELVIPAAPRTRLVAEKDGRRAATIAAPTEARADLVITLERDEHADAPRIRGVVVHSDGTPGVGATVRYGPASASADDEGRFELAISPGERGSMPLVAAKKGHQSAFVPDFTGIVHRAIGPLPEQRLVLGGPPLAIEGAVVDHEGRPKKGWTVQPLDPLVLDAGMIPPESAESVARGSALNASTDERGAFRLEDLDERSYRLQAHSKDELVRIESEPIPAGARNARLVVPADAVFARVDGVVESADGTPIAGVEIRAALITFRTESGFMSEHADPVTTDAEGRFSLKNAPRARGRIDAGGDAILPTSYDLETHVDGRLARIVAARRCHMRVEGVPAGSRIRQAQVHDAQGNALSLMQFQSNSWMSSTHVPIEGGGSPLFAVSEAARTIVFIDEDGGRTTRTLALAHGSITTVRW